ncbi:MAG: hypothetical protein D4R67_02035 [Bacteroidetes bacterium]|nr:MAG: hypothetical protein D4R67_02035 [Bacteroidota bacterium]
MKLSNTVTLLAVLITMTALLTYISCSKTEPITQIPTVTTGLISAITQTSAIAGGNVTSAGGSAVTARGVCWSTNPGPTTASGKTSDSTGTGVFISTLTGLTPNTTYYMRAYATNSKGTGYGNEKTFSTLPETPGTVSDIDGNVYHTVAIGSQVWLKENLKVTRYRKGETVYFVSGDSEWSTMEKGAYCNYDKNPTHGETYGHLYNWYAASGLEGICPEGWHVPTDTEWQELIDFLGGDATAGGKLKATGTLEDGNGLWSKPNDKATNESGFSAIPGGYRNTNGSFSQLSYNARFWSSSENLTNAWYRDLSYKYGDVERNSGTKTDGYSIRCIKDK